MRAIWAIEIYTAELRLLIFPAMEDTTYSQCSIYVIRAGSKLSAKAGYGLLCVHKST